MSRVKTKWRITYWDDYQDKLVVVGFHSYEDAQTFAHRIMKRFNRSVEIKLR